MYIVGLSILFLGAWILLQNESKWAKISKVLCLLSLGGVVVLPFFTPFMVFSGIPKFLAGAFIYIACTGYLLNSNKESRVIQLFVLIGALSFLPYFLKLPIAPNVTHSIDESAELLISVESDAVKYLEKKYELSFESAFAPKRSEETDLDEVYTIDIAEGVNPSEVLNLLKKEAGVKWIEFNDLYKIADPISSNKASIQRSSPVLNDPKINEQWSYHFLKLNAYHKFFSSKSIKPIRKAKLFILDTGIEAKHEDLSATYQSLKPTYDSDSRGHGTHCAGIAAGVSNNGIGIASLNPGKSWIDLTSIRVISRMGFAPQSTVIKGIIEATDQGADVISMSLGGMSNDNSQRAYNEAIQYALDQGVIVIAAAGNSNMPASKFSPANSKGIIAVSALDSKGKKAVFSNTVFDVEMGIAAPGVDILSTDIRNTYSLKSGTSMATPLVAGLAAVAKALNPEMTSEDFHQGLLNSGSLGPDASTIGTTIQPLDAVKKWVK